MRKQEVMGLLFSNMHDDSVRELTAGRALGSVPFGGRYRLIDFALSNMVNAGISKVGLVTKRNYQSLMDHLGSGKAWDLSRKNQGLYFLPPFGTSEEMYNGRIVSLAEIEPFLRNSKEEYVVMSDCHVVGNIDYDALLETHRDSGADITIAYKRGPVPDTPDNLLLWTAEDGRVKDIVLNTRPAGESAYGLGLYVLRKELLQRLVATCLGRNYHHFERDVLQRQVENMRLYGYEVPEMTMVISSLGSYFDANMALLNAEVRQQLFLSSRPIYTKVRDCPPALYGLHASVSHSLVADGARVDGTVRNSIIFRDVNIGRDARVENCIVMQGTAVGAGANLCYVILDKNVSIQDGRTLQGFGSYPIYIGKGSAV